MRLVTQCQRSPWELTNHIFFQANECHSDKTQECVSVNGYKRYVTQRSRGRFSMIYSASFESQLWVRNKKEKKVSYRMQKWKRKQSQKGKILSSILKNKQFISLPDDKIARLCSTHYYTRSECEWYISILHCSREKLFPQWFCYCTIPLFLFTVQGHPSFGIF